jgi:hypothetical protein
MEERQKPRIAAQARSDHDYTGTYESFMRDSRRRVLTAKLVDHGLKKGEACAEAYRMALVAELSDEIRIQHSTFCNCIDDLSKAIRARILRAQALHAEEVSSVLEGHREQHSSVNNLRRTPTVLG